MLAGMNQVERLQLIQEALSKRDFVSLDELCMRLGASKATVRRDLIELEQGRTIRRVHGGAISVSMREDALDFKLLSGSCQQEKSRIGAAAAALVQDGQTVILGGGSTVAEVARRLVDRPIQIITNSIPVAQIFWDCRQTEVTLTGGYLYPRLGIQLGPICEQMLRSVSADLAIIGIRGVTAMGLSDSSALVVESIRAMMKCAAQVTVVADHTKFGRNAMVHVASPSEFHQVISDQALAPEFREMLAGHGIPYSLV